MVVGSLAIKPFAGELTHHTVYLEAYRSSPQSKPADDGPAFTMQTVALSVAIVCLLAGAVYGGLMFDRPCPTNVPVKQYFEVDSYLGKWYEMQRYESEFEENFDCVQVRYTLNEDDSVQVSNSAYNLFNGSSINALGRAVLSFPDEEVVQGKLNVSFFGARKLAVGRLCCTGTLV